MVEDTEQKLLNKHKELTLALEEKERQLSELKKKIHFLEESREQLRFIQKIEQELLDDEYYLTKGTHYQRDVYEKIVASEENYTRGNYLLNDTQATLQDQYDKLYTETLDTEDDLQKNKRELIQCQK